MMYYYNDYYPFHFFGLGNFFGVVFMILIWGFIIYGLVSFVNHHGDHKSHKNYDREDDGALKIIRERYAKGEISREQFELMKKDLK